MNNETLIALKRAMLLLDSIHGLDEEQLGLLATHFTQEGTHILAQGGNLLSAQMHMLALLVHMQRIEECAP